MDLRQVDFWLGFSSPNVAGDVEVVLVLAYLIHAHFPRVARLLAAMGVSVEDVPDVLGGKVVLALAFFEVFGGVDEEDIVGALALFQDKDADRDAGGVEKVRGQADHGVDIAEIEELFADARFGPTAEENAVGEDDG